jgi:hypothetical protein
MRMTGIVHAESGVMTETLAELFAESATEEHALRPVRRQHLALMLSGKTAEAVEGHIQRVAADGDSDSYFEQQDGDTVFVPRLVRRNTNINGLHCIS